MTSGWNGTWSIYQDVEFGHYYARLSGQTLIRLNGLLLYVARKPLLGFTTAYLYSPEAAAVPQAVTPRRLNAFLCSRRIARMVVHTNTALASFRHHPSSGGTFVIDLKRSEEELFRGMEGRCRTAVRKGEKAGLRAEKVVDEPDLRDWYSMYSTTADERSFGRLPYSQVKGLWESSWGMLFGAFKEEKLVAGAFLLLGPYPVYLLGAMHPKYRNLSPTNSLQWEIIRWAKGEGYTCYDLGGARDDPNHGPTRFKASLGGTFHRSFSYLVKGPSLRYGMLRAAESLSQRTFAPLLGRTR